MKAMNSLRQDLAKPRRHMALLSALGLGLLLRVFFVLRFPRMSGDPMIYMDFARTLLERHVYGYTQVTAGISVAHPSLIRLPGYPLFLAGCFAFFGHTSIRTVLFVQCLIDLLTCTLAALTSAWLFGARVGWFTLWLAVLCPFTATYTAAPLTETLVLFTIALSFYALLRWQAGSVRWLFVLGAALAYSILLRPDQGLLPLAVVPAVLWLSPGSGFTRLRPALVVSVLTLLPLLPWTIRNARTMHVFQPLAPRSAADPGEMVSEGFNRWYRTWAMDYVTNETVYWTYNSDPILMRNLPARAFDSLAQREATDELLDQYNETTTETPAFDARFDALARQRTHGHAFRYYLWLPSVRVADMIFRPRTELLPVYDDWWKPHKRGTPTTIVAIVYLILNALYFGLAAYGFKRAQLNTVLWSMLSYILFRLLLLATLDNAEPRYTLEFFPILFILGGACLANLKAQTRESALTSDEV